MSHMVIYRAADGKPGYHQTDDIHDAVIFVESLRNEKDVDHARIFRLEEVNFEYKPYYRVELSVGGAPAVGAAATNGGRPDAIDASEATPVAAVAADADQRDTEDSDDHADEVDGDTIDEVIGEQDGEAMDADDVIESDDTPETVEDEHAAPAGGVRRGLFGR